MYVFLFYCCCCCCCRCCRCRSRIVQLIVLVLEMISSDFVKIGFASQFFLNGLFKFLKWYSLILNWKTMKRSRKKTKSQFKHRRRQKKPERDNEIYKWGEKKPQMKEARMFFLSSTNHFVWSSSFLAIQICYAFVNAEHKDHFADIMVRSEFQSYCV